ncbi:hypothetical protein [Spiroplasma endosymbiont of Cleonymus obscurus]|uniref:hypothetical protein n=1 Tax=Spiroplasma endosymbiont of Cleonymus obscurus TaxID=3066324 RepID=UPI0037DCB08B
MHSVKKSPSSDNKENEEWTSSEQEFQRLLKGFSKKAQETKRAEKRHKHFLSARDEKREKQSAAAKKKKHRK